MLDMMAICVVTFTNAWKGTNGNHHQFTDTIRANKRAEFQRSLNKIISRFWLNVQASLTV